MTDAEPDGPSGNKEEETPLSAEKTTPEASIKSSPQLSTHEDATSPKNPVPSDTKLEGKEQDEAKETREMKPEKSVVIEIEPQLAPEKEDKKKKKEKKPKSDQGDKGKDKKEKKSTGSEQNLEKGKKDKGKKKVKKVESKTEDDDSEEEEEKKPAPSKSSEKAPSASAEQVAAAKSSSGAINKKTEDKKKKDEQVSEVSMEGVERKKKKDKKKKEGQASEASMEGVEHQKKKDKKKKDGQASDATPEGGEQKKKKAKKKKEGQVSDASLKSAEQKKKKKGHVSMVSLEGVKGKDKKKKSAKASEESLKHKMKSEGELSEVSLDKKKGRKTPPSSEHHVADPDSLKKKASRSRTSLVRSQSSRSRPDLEQLMSRLSLHAIEMQKLRSKSAIALETDSSEWTFGSSGSSESGSVHKVEVGKKVSSKIVKKKKKSKDKKGKRKKESESSETEVSEEPESKKKKKGKGKGKKLKTVVEEETEVVVEPQVDVLAEIAKMKQMAALQASGEETETASEVPSKKKQKKAKKGPKKKLSKKEKARLAAEAAEKARINAEEEAARAAELERIRLEEERKAAIEKERREGFEQQIRMEQLEAISEQFRDLVVFNKDIRTSAKAQAEWEFYVNCGRLPNPSKCDQMNTFLHLWENVIQETSMEEAARRTVDVLELLNELDDLIDTAEKGSEGVENWKWVRLLFRRQQAKSLDVATYRLLRNIEKNLNRIDIPTADYKYQDDNIALCLWLRIQLPTPLPNPRRPPKPRIEVNFPQMKMEVQFPLTIDGEKVAVRALYVKYDHLSDLSESYEKPPIPQQYDIDLYSSMKIEWREKLLYKYENRVRKSPPPTPPNEESQEGDVPKGPPPEPTIGPDDEVPIVPYRKLEPTASEFVIAREDELYSGTRTQLIKTVPDDIINLRKFSIIGGVYSLNLLHQPPQPQDFVTLEMTLTPLYLPKELGLVDLYLEYYPPIPPDASIRRPPEEIEEEMKKLEEELEKLVLVTLTWPEHVIFLELPMVCYWDDERRVWSKSEVHDLKHNEEKGQLSFRTRKGAIFALAVYRYANLPYQAWEMRPEVNGSISLQITAAILMVEFNVKDGLIALSQLQNSPNNALQDIVGTYFPLPKLIRILQSAGVDVFPAFDAFGYIESSCEKHWPMEKHLYFNMAQLGVCFNFAWSRWNMAAGRRNVIFQMREYNLEKTKQKNHLMLHVTPLSALYVDCTEVSQTFNEQGIENMKFYPDLFHLMKGTSSMAVKNKIAKASKELIFVLYELLIATRVVSFS